MFRYCFSFSVNRFNVLSLGTGDVVTQWVVALREASNRCLDQSERELSCLQPMIVKLVFGPITKKSAKYDDDAVH